MEIFSEWYKALFNCKTDDIQRELLDTLIVKAIKYTDIRLKWQFYDFDEKVNYDSFRTTTHNGFIDALQIYCRYIKLNEGDVFGNQLKTMDRKEIGDFACFIAYKIAISNR